MSVATFSWGFMTVHMACVKASLRSPYAWQPSWYMTTQEDPGVSQMGPDLAVQLLPSSWEM